MNAFAVQFGEVVQSLRKARGLSQDALAKRARFSRPFINLIESGRKTVSLQNLYPLAAALGVEPGVLVERAKPAHLMTLLEQKVQSDMADLIDAAAADGEAWSTQNANDASASASVPSRRARSGSRNRRRSTRMGDSRSAAKD